MFVIILIIIEILSCKSSFAKVEVTSGVYLEKLPHVHLYEASSPLLFTVNIGYVKERFCANACNMSLCRTLEEMTMTSFTLNSDHFKESETLLDDDGNKEYELVTKSHVKRLFTNTREVNLLQERMKSRNLTWEEITLSSDKLNRWTKLCDTSLWGYILMYQSRMMSFLQMCQMKKLRPDIIPFSKMETMLKKYKKLWEPNGYMTTFQELAKYYDTPLVECLLTDTIAMIGVHVPLIRRSTQKIEVRRLITPSFAWNGYTCSLGLALTDLAFPEGQYNSSVFIPRCDPLREDTCFLAEPSGEYMASILCAKVVLSGASVQVLSETCPMECRETGTDVQYVTPLSNGRFLINHMVKNLTAICKGGRQNIIIKENIGAMEVYLPCGCSLSPINRGSLRTREQCITQSLASVSYHTVIPASWSKIRSMRIPAYHIAEKPLFLELDDCLDRNWLTSYLDRQTERSPYYHYLTLLVDLALFGLLAGGFYYLRHFVFTTRQSWYLYLEDRLRVGAAFQRQRPEAPGSVRSGSSASTRRPLIPMLPVSNTPPNTTEYVAMDQFHHYEIPISGDR